MKDWLSTLFRPYVMEAYRIVREQHGLPPVDASKSTTPSPTHDHTGCNYPSPARSPSPCPGGGHLSLFNQSIQQKHLVVEWIYNSDRGPGTKTTPIWRVEAKLDGECIAEGRGSTKKAAQTDAARAGLKWLGVKIVRLRMSPNSRLH